MLRRVRSTKSAVSDAVSFGWMTNAESPLTSFSVLLFCDCLISFFLTFRTSITFKITVKNWFQFIHLSEMQTAFIDGHFILSRSLREGLCYRRSSDRLLIAINNIYFIYINSTLKRQVLKLIH